MITFSPRFKKKKSSPPYLITFLTFLITGILIFSSFLNFKIVKKIARVSTELNYLEEEIKDLELKKKKLSEKISGAEKESYLEKIAKEEKNLKWPGEKVVAFLLLKNQNEEQGKENQIEKKNYWQEILEKFGIR